MPRLINADRVDQKLQDTHDGLEKLFKNKRFEFMRDNIAAQITTIHEIRRMIMTVPTIDAEPVRHGRWVKTEYDDYVCSLCGEEAPNDGYDCGAKYCYECGAKMDAKE